MIVTIAGSAFTVGVKEYDAIFESGILWNQVGGKHKPLDRGPATAKWMSDITIKASGLYVANLREAMLSQMRDGGSIMLQLETFETVFGPEFSYANSFECLVDASENPFQTGNMNTSVPTEWTFTAYPTCYMPDRYLSYSSTFPENVSMISAQRLDNSDSNIIESATSRVGVSYGFNAPTAEIAFEGLLIDVAKAKSFLQVLRSSTTTLTSALVWPFSVNEVEENVYVLDVSDNGPLDKAGNYYSFTAVFGRV